MKRVVAVMSVGIAYAYASACAGVAPSGQPVTFGDQSNIIVWNPETRTEHFVRNAYFDSKAKDFGFIAATPSVPELSEASTKAFDHLRHLKPMGPVPSCSAGDADNVPAATNGAVEVLQQVDVGKYSATTVRSEKADNMTKYLKSNGYVSSPDTDEWVRFYTGKKWVFTAFKVREGAEGKSETGVVRMSFKTDEPFNPYYVPNSNTGTGEPKLKLWFVSDGTYSATVGHDKGWIPASWNNEIGPASLGELANDLNLKSTDFPIKPTVTYFEKVNWMDGTKDDLYFRKDSRFGQVVLAIIVAIAAGLWWLTKSNRSRALKSLA